MKIVPVIAQNNGRDTITDDIHRVEIISISASLNTVLLVVP